MIKTSRFNTHLIEERQVRIFLSSTFSDMQKERSELVKIFEYLKVEAAKRNVTLSVVDLRWGITKEESQSGKVISICLEEIEHSHPFFIGILGNNYGTAPKSEELDKNPDLKERYEWLKDAITDDNGNGMSITEMEIQYGVLTNKNDIDAAFYFRESDEPDNNERLTHLKKEIREYCHSKGRDDLPRSYSDVSELCNYVMEEVIKILDKHFPVANEITALDRERSAQKAFINNRHLVYHERLTYYSIINDFIADAEQQYLVFTGKSGIGKSALLANWIINNDNNPNFNIIYHFIGNTFSDNTPESILRHICDEIYELYEINDNKKPNEKIAVEAQRLIEEVSQKGKPLVVVIDGINQIVTSSTGQEKLLLWLPSASKNVKFIFSTLPGDETMDTFKRRNYRIEEIEPLSYTELEKWVPDYLIRLGKKLEPYQLKTILDWSANEPINGNMLAIRTLLDELTRFGVYEKVDERIDYYTSSTSIPEFFERVLNSLENDYSPESKLVKHSLTLISISEHGLSESELMTILGCEQRPLEWKLFFCAFYNNFVITNGLITFSHQYIAEAINQKYHIDIVDETAPFRQEIIDYFSRPTTKEKTFSNRNISELAHQYYKLSEWDNLYSILLRFDAFHFYYNNNQTLLGYYWRALIHANAEKYTLASFKKLPSDGDANMLASTFNNIAYFIENYINNFDLSISFYDEALKYYKEKGGIDYAIVCNNIGGILETKGLYKLSVFYYQESLRVKKYLFGENHPEIALTYNNIGYTYCQWKDYKNAYYWLDKALYLKLKLYGPMHLKTATTYGNIGQVFFDEWAKGNHDSDNLILYVALLHFNKAKEIVETMLSKYSPRLAKTYDNIGAVYQGLGVFEQAKEYHEKALSIFRTIYEYGHIDIASTYINLGSLYYQSAETQELDRKNCYLKALDYYHEALQIYQNELGDEHPLTQNTKKCIASLRQTIESLK